MIPGDPSSWKANIPVLLQGLPELSDWDESILPTNATFDKPTLFIAGGRSSYVTEQDHEDIYRRFPKAQIETLPDVGHWVHAEAPDRFIEVLSEFLDSHSL